MTSKPRLSLEERLEQGAQAYLDWRAELEAEPGYAEEAAEIRAKFDQWDRITWLHNNHRSYMTYKKMAAILKLSIDQAKVLYDHGYDLYSVDELRQFADALDDDIGLPHP